MPKISRAEKARNREKIIDAASRLFRAEGIDNVAIDDLMKDAGLTHGGFYNHFTSKDALAAEASRAAFAVSRRQYAEMIESANSASPLMAVWRYYLSAQHRDDLVGGCSSASLLTDACRQGAEVQAAYADGIESLIGCFTDQLLQETGMRGGSTGTLAARQQVIRLLVGMVGAVVLARAVQRPAPALSDEILEASRSCYPLASE